VTRRERLALRVTAGLTIALIGFALYLVSEAAFDYGLGRLEGVAWGVAAFAVAGGLLAAALRWHHIRVQRRIDEQEVDIYAR
jgi:predicted cobalt transporter CbtA